MDIYDGVIHSKTMNLVETSFGVEVTFCHKTKVLICEIVVRCFFVCKMINSGMDRQLRFAAVLDFDY